ncbi:MAG: aminotransferase class V-fold PLP-dependent enzyme [candidate division SR1 bacterium]|nr:aminotransferase class V-fold PLP-dependent enzyme [candidate division SR1 bacterium]
MKKDFPVFKTNPGLVFLDSAASSQKPKYVIDGVSEFVASSYANIHRGSYALSEKSEDAYHASKTKVAEFLNVKANEIIYSYNATYAINLIAQALCKSKYLEKGDVVLVGIRDHHANIVPRQSLSEEYGFVVKFINIRSDYTIDRQDFNKKYDKKVKVVACSHISNVTGAIYDVSKIKEHLRLDTFFLVDGSQSVPHIPVDISKIGCDCFVFTAHKMMGYTGLGITYLAKEWIKKLQPLISGGGAIHDVDINDYTPASGVDKFEAGTPNIIAAVSLLKALEYIQKIGGMNRIWTHEQQMTAYVLAKFLVLEKAKKLELIGPRDVASRVGVFSFILPKIRNTTTVGEKFAAKKIAVRCGGHCAYPLHKHLNKAGSCRMSLYLYNDKKDIDTFFAELEKMVK